jgi:hypothetical protein
VWVAVRVLPRFPPYLASLAFLAVKGVDVTLVVGKNPQNNPRRGLDTGGAGDIYVYHSRGDEQ